ncbi:insulin-like peptide receptor [Uloborus diversus]|uniref:insulin-like peptide receptor n=1 Tax=Uloborus diversus TaxID=327109 RepID=UPI002409E676|nr:insulin-like peptide receptor [Uloborus diversus]
MGRRPLPPLLAVVLLCFCWPIIGETKLNEIVCKNVDIRNSVENFRKLDNCTVIEGYLQILLIDNGQAHEYDGLVFPDLVEITGYLLLYRAFGLNSVGRLFPNLAVIRGNVLFHNYAMVVFEMYHLQEIGLTRLTDILRGSVRIEKNPGLCYVDTIDWDLVARQGRGGHFIKANKKWDECPNTCPEPDLCPQVTREDGKSLRLCWNPQNCQKICAPQCGQENATCQTDPEKCCAKECLGGCYGPSSSDCVACRHVMYSGRCMRKCPPGTFELLGRRCIQENECRMYEDNENQQTIKYWKAFMGQCVIDCPAGYVESEKDRHVCKKCEGKCPKVCQGLVVDHVSAAQKLSGCTYLNGSLEIHIQGGANVIKELEENMNMIEEIHGYLKVARSFPLVSLNFLKSLTTIHGEQLDKKEYAFLVLDNQNLQELWDWKTHKEPLRIKKGKIFFHFNSKLCPSKITELKKFAQTLDWDDRDVSPSSNGDRVACDVTNMNVSVINLAPSVVKVRWDSFRKYLFDERSLLGYVIYYRETPYQNITIFEGRDACGTDVWTVRDVELGDETNEHIDHIIAGLKPFTQYALYIRTYTTASGRQGAQSSVVYFKTDSSIPTPPVNIKAHSTLHGEIVISWKPPKTPNGNVTHYIVEGSHDKEQADFVNQRNYCLEPLPYPKYRKPSHDDELVKLPTDYVNSSFSEGNQSADCCPCEKEHRNLEDDDNAEFQIHFEDFLHNNVYKKNPNLFRRKRHIPSSNQANVSLKANVSSFGDSTGSETIDGNRFVNGSLMQFKRSVYHNTFIVISNLKHFTEYTIEVRACQDPHPNSKRERCSSKAITSVRTLHLSGADDIKSGSVQIQTENITSYSGFIRWEEPKDSNGMIVAYNIEYQRLDGEYFKPILICITRSAFLEHGGFHISDLSPGNYSLRVRATSLAGRGNWTHNIYFVISAVPENYIMEIALVVSLIFFFALLLGAMYGVYKWKFKSHVPDYVDYASVNPEYISSNLVYEPDEWEIPREKVKLLEELGQGSFGMVYKGEVHDLNDVKVSPCAAKTVNETASLRERIEFLQEASVMKAFSCNHVIKLLGVVSKGQPTLVIMELMPNGDLKTYLRSHRPDEEENPGQQPPTLKQILQMAAEIADGMAYLAAKKFVHRDLAARNCMVAEDLTVKIGDFGMTRDVYETDYYRKGGKGLLPVRWMSPESLKDGIFDSQTDVWSYGIVLWEMATLASQPYQGLSNEDVLKFVIAGNTMKKPEDCPEKLYNLMVMCWHRHPKARPTFIEIIEMLLPDVNQKFHQVSYYFTQRHLLNPSDFEDNATPSTPLRVSMNSNNLSESAYRYFPSATQLPDEESGGAGEAAACSDVSAVLVNSNNEGSKGISINCSDGSKDSKISSISNGSVANGHVNRHTGTAAKC